MGLREDLEEVLRGPDPEPEHDPDCQWENGGRPCRRFSPDRTLLGAEIAHEQGTTSALKVIQKAREESQQLPEGHEGWMDEEQADWDEEVDNEREGYALW